MLNHLITSIMLLSILTCIGCTGTRDPWRGTLVNINEPALCIDVSPMPPMQLTPN